MVKRRKSGISKAHKTSRPSQKIKRARTVSETASYFDDIPDIAVENIVCLVSTTPHHENWTAKIPVDMLLSLLRCSGSLSRVSSYMFSSLWYSNKKCWSGGYVAVIGDQQVLHPSILELLAKLGEGLRSLNIADQRSKPLTDAITSHCTGLRNLSLAGFSSSKRHFDEILRTCGSSLEYLCVHSLHAHDELLLSIATHCRSVRHLKLDCRSVVNSFGPVWEGLGKSLEHLELDFAFLSNPELEVDKLIASCPNISQLALYAWGYLSNGLQQELERLITAYGPNLTKLTLLGNIEQPALSRICEACPNARMHVGSTADTDTIVALGSAATRWIVSTRDVGYTENWFSSVGASCPNLQECNVSCSGTKSLSETAFNDLFVSPKPQLRQIDVCVAKRSCISMILKVLTAKVSTLESFTYKGPYPRLDTVRGFVHSQKELKTVRLHSRGQRCLCHGDVAGMSEKQMGPAWASIVSIFLESSTLKEIVCRCCNYNEYMADTGYGGWAEEIADACCLVRTRHISISVCGVQYK